MKNIYKFKNVDSHTYDKDVVDTEYCNKNLLSSSNKIDILSKNIVAKRKVSLIQSKLILYN